MPDQSRRPEQQPVEITKSKTEQQNRQLDPETRDRIATNDGQVRRPNGVGDADDIGAGRE
jgi:hypothetical protein